MPDGLQPLLRVAGPRALVLVVAQAHVALARLQQKEWAPASGWVQVGGREERTRPGQCLCPDIKKLPAPSPPLQAGAPLAALPRRAACSSPARRTWSPSRSTAAARRRTESPVPPGKRQNMKKDVNISMHAFGSAERGPECWKMLPQCRLSASIHPQQRTSQAPSVTSSLAKRCSTAAFCPMYSASARDTPYSWPAELGKGRTGET